MGAQVQGNLALQVADGKPWGYDRFILGSGRYIFMPFFSRSYVGVIRAVSDQISSRFLRHLGSVAAIFHMGPRQFSPPPSSPGTLRGDDMDSAISVLVRLRNI